MPCWRFEMPLGYFLKSSVFFLGCLEGDRPFLRYQDLMRYSSKLLAITLKKMSFCKCLPIAIPIIDNQMLLK